MQHTLPAIFIFAVPPQRTKKERRVIRKLSISLVAVAAFLPLVNLACQAAERQPVMTHQIHEAVRNGTAMPVGRLPGGQILQLDLVLQLRDRAGLQSLLAQQYDRQSPMYHHWITPQEFTELFGPTREDYDAVINLRANTS